MSENNESVMDKVKGMFHEDVKSRREVTGGAWDSKANTYSLKDEASGVTTVYSLKKNKSLESGYSVKTKTYKEQADATGKTKMVEVTFDKKKNAWVPGVGLQKALDMLPSRPKFMGTLVEQNVPGQPEPVKSLVIEPAKFKPQTPVVFVPVR